jgi:hypothetical protein
MEEQDILKEAFVYFAGEPKKYTYINSRIKSFPVAAMSRILEVQPSDFYA